MWDTVFAVTNAISLAGWATLILAPRTPLLRSLVLYAAVGLLCLIYAVLLIGLSGDWLDAGGRNAGLAELATDYSVDGLTGLFQSRGGVVVGWTHYLAFDLFAGWWIAGDADRSGLVRWRQVPILIATFLAGPLGLATYLVWRRLATEDKI